VAYLARFKGQSRIHTEPDLRGVSVPAGFYRTCVIDGVLAHSPTEYARRPNVPAESPTLGLAHLQFEALPTAAKQSPNRCDFALVTMLGLLGLRIFEDTGSNIDDLGEEHGHRVLRVRETGQSGPRSAATSCQPGHRTLRRRASIMRHPAHLSRHTHGAPLCYPATPTPDPTVRVTNWHPNYILAAYMASGT